MQIRNNTILITGGTAGIGLELATRLMELGNEVVVTGRDPRKLEKVKKEFPGIHQIKSDVTQISEIDSLFEQVTKQFPRLNFIINNAGTGQTLDLREPHASKKLSQEIETNLLAPIHIINKFLPHLLKQENSAIVNVSSALGFLPMPLVPIYSASKAGLHSYTLSLRAQLKNTSVKVFELAPPTTQTEMLHGFGSDSLKNVSIMQVSGLVFHALRGLERDQFEICPGQARTLQFMSRLAPSYVLHQMEKSLRRQVSERKQK